MTATRDPFLSDDDLDWPDTACEVEPCGLAWVAGALLIGAGLAAAVVIGSAIYVAERVADVVAGWLG